MSLHNDSFKRWEFDNQYRLNGEIISGSDEAGRGAMAGPVVVASVILPKDYKNKDIKDSKQLSLKKREELFKEIKDNALDYSISIISNEMVDKINPKASSVLGMKKTIMDLKIKPNVTLIDGEKLKDFDQYNPVQLIKGDDKSQSIAAASILAKVTRDRIMDMYGKIYPEYGFEKHKGYCTKSHTESTEKYGVLPIHRITYSPIKKIIEKQ